MNETNTTERNDFVTGLRLAYLGGNFASLRMAIGMERAIAERKPGFTYARAAAESAAQFPTSAYFAHARR